MMMIFRSTFLLASMGRPCGTGGAHGAVGMAPAPGGAAQILFLLPHCHPGMSLCPHRACAMPALVFQAWWGQKPPPCQARPTAPPAPGSGGAGARPGSPVHLHSKLPGATSAPATPSPAQSLPLSLAHAPGALLKINFLKKTPAGWNSLVPQARPRKHPHPAISPQDVSPLCPSVPTGSEPGQDP